MLYAYQATNRSKQLDVRDRIQRLRIDLRAETTDDEQLLARVRNWLNSRAEHTAAIATLCGHRSAL